MSDTEDRKRYYSRYPMRDPAYLVMRAAGREIERAGSLYLKGKLIDIGCGEKWKKDLVGRFVDEYIGLDHADTQHDKSNIDLLGTVYKIPVDDNTFDSAICTAVLEHVEEPSDAIKECLRVLDKGGHAVYTVPLFWHLHEEPRDFFRYTKYGLEYLFEKNGFEIIEIKALSGFWITFSTEWCYYLQQMKKHGKWNPLSWIVRILTVMSHVVASFFNRFDHSEAFTWMYLVVVRKRNDEV